MNKYELVEYGEMKRELKILSNIETVLMSIMAISTIGLIIGFFVAPIVFVISATTYLVAAFPLMLLSGRVSSLRISVSVRKSSLHIED